MISHDRSLAFPKTCRILSKKDFEYLRDRSSKNSALPLICYSKPSRVGASFLRLGLSISKKQGSAVQRNRIKRILKEEFRHHPKRHLLSKDILIVAAQKIDTEESLRLRFKELMERLK